MAGVYNNTARPMTLNCRQKRGGLIKYRINPMQTVQIPDGEWNLLKKSKVVSAYLQKGDLATGKMGIILPPGFEADEEQKELEENLDNRSQEEIDADNQAEIDALDEEDK